LDISAIIAEDANNINVVGKHAGMWPRIALLAGLLMPATVAAQAPAAPQLCVDAGATDAVTLARIRIELGRIPGVRSDCPTPELRFYLFVEPVAGPSGSTLGYHGAVTWRAADMGPLEINLTTYTGAAFDDVFIPAFLRVAVEAIMPRLRR
jgi:hypothetical protein